MPRRPSLNPNEKLHISLNTELKAKLGLVLWSDVEGRVPYGAWQSFIEARIREWFEDKRQPLEHLGFPPGFYIAGPAVMVDAVVKRLEGN